MSDTRTGLPSRGSTLYAIQQAQIARERTHKLTEREAATMVVKQHAQTEDWSSEDLEQVMGALGLTPKETNETA